MLSDPGAFTKGAEKQAETMKGMGIEQTDAKAEAKKKEEEQKKKGLYSWQQKNKTTQKHWYMVENDRWRKSLE